MSLFGTVKKGTPTPTSSQKAVSRIPSTAPKKTDAPLNVTTQLIAPDKEHRDLGKCPCGNSSDTSWKMDCSKCKQYWHTDCLGMKGIPKAACNKMIEWLCPFCYVAPIPTMGRDTDLCHMCRNTATLQQANSDFEVHAASENLASLKTLGKSLAAIDVDELKERINAVEMFDLHLKHLLTDEHGLKSYVDSVKKIESDVSSVSDDMKSHQSCMKHVESGVNSVSVTMKTHDTALNFLTLQITSLQNDVHKLASCPPPVEALTAIAENDQFMKSIEEKLDLLCSSEDDMRQAILRNMPSCPPKPPASQQLPSPQRANPLARNNFEHIEEPVSATVEDFIDIKAEGELTLLCKSFNFANENGHSVISFGEQYKYTGSKSPSSTQPIPPSLAPLVKKVNEKFCADGGPHVNSVLINHYDGAEGYLPRHSDDEGTIHPESSIFTLSLGQDCNIVFTEKEGDVHSTHKCKARSIYCMTRRSQEHYQHEIEKGSVTGGSRYSVTFRSVNPKNRGATCIIGDSNAAGLKFGKDFKRNFGEWFPGRNYWAPVIDDINPYVTCGYRNVVLMCGTNDIRKSSVKSHCDIHDIFSLLVYKIEQIQSLNPQAHVYICPILPTKSVELNRKALYFVNLIRTELLPSNFGVTFVDGFDGFLDRQGLLCQSLSRTLDKYGREDILHLNWKGVAKLAVLVRDTVLLRMSGGIDRRRRSSRRVDGTPYSTVAGGEDHREGYQPPS